ncbi:MAG: hypothetical protein H7039_10075, partial [Bryobacteraceae bacterium]|nr:hypothetical protein [Bryobacteraceae bacterium]
MRILSVLTPKSSATRSDFERLSLSEEKTLWQFYSGHKVREMYFQPEPIKILLVWEEENFSKVNELLATFPMVQEDLFSIELIHLGPWMPLQALFREEALQ